jgi:hypothetical protein
MPELPASLDPEPKAIAVMLSVTTQISERRTIVAQTYIERDDPIGSYHKTLDKITEAVDRQEAKYRKVALGIELTAHEKTLAQLEEDYIRIGERTAAEWLAKGKKGDPALSPSERSQKANAEVNIKRYRQEIAKLKAEIVLCEAIIAKG